MIIIINEWPPVDRFRNTVLAGVLVRTHEPDVTLMSTIIEAFAKQTKRLFHDGVYVRDTLYKFVPLACVVDSVARPIIQNRLQYNGYYGCSWCYHPGRTVGRTVKYPIDMESDLCSKATHIEDLLGVQANRYRRPIRGVKGPTTSLHLPHFDPVWSFPVEYMHEVLLGTYIKNG